MVEIKDIRDELNILQMVLNDQRENLAKFIQIVEGADKQSRASTTIRIDVVDSHLHRIEKMEILAQKTYESVRIRIQLRYIYID